MVVFVVDKFFSFVVIFLKLFFSDVYVNFKDIKVFEIGIIDFMNLLM